MAVKHRLQLAKLKEDWRRFKAKYKKISSIVYDKTVNVIFNVENTKKNCMT